MWLQSPMKRLFFGSWAASTTRIRSRPAYSRFLRRFLERQAQWCIGLSPFLAKFQMLEVPGRGRINVYPPQRRRHQVLKYTQVRRKGRGGDQGARLVPSPAVNAHGDVYGGMTGSRSTRVARAGLTLLSTSASPQARRAIRPRGARRRSMIESIQ